MGSHRFASVFSTVGSVVYSISPNDNRCGSKGPCARMVSASCVAPGPDTVKAGIIEHVGRTDQLTV